MKIQKTLQIIETTTPRGKTYRIVDENGLYYGSNFHSIDSAIERLNEAEQEIKDGRFTYEQVVDARKIELEIG